MIKNSFIEIEKELESFNSVKNKIHLLSFVPICYSKSGKIAVQEYGLKPFINGDFRREPDLENEYPAISLMKHKRFLASPVKLGDIIVFWVFDPLNKDHRLVAILRVLELFGSHQKAANWYLKNKLPLPSNCVVKNNPLIPFELTKGKYGTRNYFYTNRFYYSALTEKEYLNSTDEIAKEKLREKMMEGMDVVYNHESKMEGRLIVTEKVILNLDNPPVIKKEEFIFYFGERHSHTVPFYIKQEGALLKLARLLHFG